MSVPSIGTVLRDASAATGGQRRDDHGFGLVELLVAVLILVVGLLGVAGVLGGSVRTLRDARQRQQAVVLAGQSVETARTHTYAALAMRAGSAEVPGTTWDPDGAGPLPAEPVVATASGAVTGAAHRTTPAGSGALRLTTYVTWADDPWTTTSTQDLKRVTAVVTWTTGARTRDVRSSTLIADLR